MTVDLMLVLLPVLILDSGRPRARKIEDDDENEHDQCPSRLAP